MAHDQHQPDKIVEHSVQHGGNETHNSLSGKSVGCEQGTGVKVPSTTRKICEGPCGYRPCSSGAEAGYRIRLRDEKPCLAIETIYREAEALPYDCRLSKDQQCRGRSTPFKALCVVFAPMTRVDLTITVEFISAAAFSTGISKKISTCQSPKRPLDQVVFFSGPVKW